MKSDEQVVGGFDSCFYQFFTLEKVTFSVVWHSNNSMKNNSLGKCCLRHKRPKYELRFDKTKLDSFRNWNTAK